jgi:hypothetical protein
MDSIGKNRTHHRPHGRPVDLRSKLRDTIEQAVPDILEMHIQLAIEEDLLGKLCVTIASTKLLHIRRARNE